MFLNISGDADGVT